MENEKILEFENKVLDFEGKANHYRWLKSIADDYSHHIALIEREGDCYRVSGLRYVARSEGRAFELNPHYTISYTYILDGLRDALERVNAEIEECRKELEGMMV